LNSVCVIFHVLLQIIIIPTSKVFVVTTATDGIGLHIVNRLRVDRTRYVYMGAQDAKAGHQVWLDMGSPRNVSVLKLDVEDLDSISAAITRIRGVFGRIDALINIAGVSEDQVADSIESRLHVIDVNVWGAMRICELFYPIIRKGGRIVNMCALSGYPTNCKCADLTSRLQSPQLTRLDLQTLMDEYTLNVSRGTCEKAGWPTNVYAVSEMGEAGFSGIIAREMASSSNLAVMFCCPGFGSTSMVDGQDRQTPWQAAEVPVWLAADLCDQAVHALNGASFTHNKEIQFLA